MCRILSFRSKEIVCTFFQGNRVNFGRNVFRTSHNSNDPSRNLQCYFKSTCGEAKVSGVDSDREYSKILY